jgi:hypothetical protein
MSEQSQIFEKIYKDYLEQVAGIDCSLFAEKLGIRVSGKAIEIPFFNQMFTITPDAVTDGNGMKPHHAMCVILCRYLLSCPETLIQSNELATYKDFKDAAPYVQGFRNTAEQPIARHFSGNLKLLKQKCLELGGKPYATDVSCDLAMQFQALPMVPVFLIFNDADEDFSSQCTLLFQKNLETYLDMECVAMVGNMLFYWLTE